MPVVSIIIPALDEQENMTKLGDTFSTVDEHIEIIVVDGGSQDETVSIAERFAHRVIQSERGRATQMNIGATEAKGQLLLFLHADVRLPPRAIVQLKKLASFHNAWGRFDMQLDNPRMVYRLIEWSMNARSRLTKICTGDQAIFVSRDLFDQVDGFPQQPLMEDIEISKRLKPLGQFFPLKSAVTTRPRYWEQHGILRATLRMWQLRLMYFFGTTPKDLHRRYYG